MEYKRLKDLDTEIHKLMSQVFEMEDGEEKELKKIKITELMDERDHERKLAITGFMPRVMRGLNTRSYYNHIKTRDELADDTPIFESNGYYLKADPLDPKLKKTIDMSDDIENDIRNIISNKGFSNVSFYRPKHRYHSQIRSSHNVEFDSRYAGFTIYLLEDEWFCVDKLYFHTGGKKEYYLCDQLDGLQKFIEEQV